MLRPTLEQCKCSLRIRLVGDGCQHCNPERWNELTEGEIDGLFCLPDDIDQPNFAAQPPEAAKGDSDECDCVQ